MLAKAENGTLRIIQASAKETRPVNNATKHIPAKTGKGFLPLPSSATNDVLIVTPTKASITSKNAFFVGFMCKSRR